MVRRNQFALALLFLLSLVAAGCSGSQKPSLSPVVAHLQAKGYQGEANPLRGDVLGADEVLSFAGKDTTVKSRSASASARVNSSSAGSNDFTAVLYLFSDSDKARAYAYKSKGIPNGPFVIEVFKGDDNLVAAFLEYRP